MDQDHKPPNRSRFSTLPIEIRQAILCAMPDLLTFHLALETFKSLRQAFLANHSSICNSFIPSVFPSRVLPDLLALSESTQFNPWRKERRRSDDPWNEERVADLMRRHYGQPLPRDIQWTYADIARISGIQEHINFFIDDFASTANSARPNGDGNQPQPLTRNERSRIEVAFFRFELYCNLFRQRGVYTSGGRETHERIEEGHWKLFFDFFSPWENEQLACVHDYLADKVVVPFDDVSDHDIYWGEESISCHEDTCLDAELYIQSLLSKGLAVLHRLVAASTYEERHKLLGIIPSSDWDFLSSGMIGDPRELSYGQYRPYSMFGQDEREALQSKTSTQDPDRGPCHAWFWAHESYNGESGFYNRDHELLRKMGYVMWDDWRLEHWGILEKPFDEKDYPAPDKSLSEERIKEFKESCQRRSEIWRRGGLGWWSKDDESKIEWPKDRKPDVIRAWFEEGAEKSTWPRGMPRGPHFGPGGTIIRDRRL
ncbi:hypothetical protein FQN54_004371 [Arachnomyces sp. PD_36]|nr:hypothetical protein FQN54_004371 [Arachnomyces sp. PD_36]